MGKLLLSVDLKMQVLKPHSCQLLARNFYLHLPEYMLAVPFVTLTQNYCSFKLSQICLTKSPIKVNGQHPAYLSNSGRASFFAGLVVLLLQIWAWNMSCDQLSGGQPTRGVKLLHHCNSTWWFW